MSYEIEGEIVFIGETETFASGFCKRLVVVKAQDGNYENEYGFELMKERVDMADGLSVGHAVEVKFNLGRAREYNGKWYSQAHTAWSIKATGETAGTQAPPQVADDLPMCSDLDVPF